MNKKKIIFLRFAAVIATIIIAILNIPSTYKGVSWVRYNWIINLVDGLNDANYDVDEICFISELEGYYIVLFDNKTVTEYNTYTETESYSLGIKGFKVKKLHSVEYDSPIAEELKKRVIGDVTDNTDRFWESRLNSGRPAEGWTPTFEGNDIILSGKMSYKNEKFKWVRCRISVYYKEVNGKYICWNVSYKPTEGY